METTKLYLKVIVTLFLFKNSFANYRKFGMHNGYKSGYINLKKFTGKKLNMTSFNTTTTKTRKECAKGCVMTSLTCESINMTPLEDGMVNCSLLGLNKHSSSAALIDSNDGTDHYAISVS